VHLPPQRLDETVESTAYYVVAESLANAQRYARSSSIVLRISLVRDVLHVRIADNGVGGAREGPGSGLEGLRDRVESVGGSFTVVSAPTRGTHIHAAIPLTSPATGVPDSPAAQD
jgi:signal transduction histidine kinase